MAKESSIWAKKSKFFFYRAVTYFSFLLIPIWIQKSLQLGIGFQMFIMAMYILFMTGQWFLLGKEIDHRLKIYFKFNSSLDRVAYRLIMGMSFICLYFNLLNFLPSKWVYNFFWVTWAILGLFYSWPTRGKIIQESVTSHFSEFRYLDSFEKTLFALIATMFIFSVPRFPELNNYEALRLFFDPIQNYHDQFWTFLTINYFPFKKYPELFRIALGLHFYLVGVGLFLIVFYAILRHFVSRRLSLLGVFAVLSSWSFSKILDNNFGSALITTYSVIWVWAGIWIIKSSTYRSGLFWGIIHYVGTLLNPTFFTLYLYQFATLFLVFLKEKNIWYKKQILKYSSFGLFFSIIIFISQYHSIVPRFEISPLILINLKKILVRKAFFSLSIIGLIFIIFQLTQKKILRSNMNIDHIKYLLISFAGLLIHSVFFDDYLTKDFSLMWAITLISLIPIEIIFQNMSRLRSKRNMW